MHLDASKSGGKSTKNTNVHCDATQIFNPITKRCVLIKGAAGKKVIQSYIDGKLELSPQDVSKITKYLPPQKKKLNIITTKQQSTIEGTNMPTISQQTKDKIHKFVENWKKTHSTYTDDAHETYCKSTNRNASKLSKPIVAGTAYVTLPVLSKLHQYFDPRYLDHKNFMIVDRHIKYNFNNYTFSQSLHKGHQDSLQYYEGTIDMDWLRDMNDYIGSLSIKDLYTCIGYTFYGDVVANLYLRDALNKNLFEQKLQNTNWKTTFFPLFFQALEVIQKTPDINSLFKPNATYLNKTYFDPNLKLSKLYESLVFMTNFFDYDKFWKKVIEMYIDDLERIIQKAPPLKKKLVVYRGVKDDYYLKGQAGHIYSNNAFVSTSLNLESALVFSGQNCCFKRITLLPGCRVLLLSGITTFSNELEVLLSRQSKFYITKDKATMNKDTLNTCPLKSQSITVTDVVVVK